MGRVEQAEELLRQVQRGARELGYADLTTTEVLPLVGIADVAIAQRPEKAGSAGAPQLTVPRQVQVPLPMEVTERFLEFDLAESIPGFPVPLQAEDVAPAVDLQQLVNEVYIRAGFDLANRLSATD